MSSTRGKLLLASPVMEPSFFAQSVIAMVEHDDEGSFGLVLNHPMPLQLAEAWKNISEDPCPRKNTPIHRGGPVPGPLVALHNHPAHAEKTLCQGVYFCSTEEHVSAIATTTCPAVFFASYSGWGSGQLETELQSTSWIVGPRIGPWLLDHSLNQASDAAPEDLWRLCMQMTDPALGRLARNPQIVPADPLMN